MSNENNSSAPLKTAGEPFVALGECIADQVCLSVAELPDRDSPADWPQAMLVTSDELRNIVLNAINYAAQAVEAQAAPAAVAVPSFEAWAKAVGGDFARHNCGPYVTDAMKLAGMAWHAALAATPALPATDSSAGDLATESVLIEGVAYTIPEPVALELLRLNIELQQAEVQAEPVIYVSRGQLETHTDPDSDGGRYLPARRTPLGLLNYPLYTAPQAQPADALDAKRWRSVAHDHSLHDLAVVRVDEDGDCEMLTGDEANEAIDAAMAAAQEGDKACARAIQRSVMPGRGTRGARTQKVRLSASLRGAVARRLTALMSK